MAGEEFAERKSRLGNTLQEFGGKRKTRKRAENWRGPGSRISFLSIVAMVACLEVEEKEPEKREKERLIIWWGQGITAGEMVDAGVGREQDQEGRCRDYRRIRAC